MTADCGGGPGSVGRRLAAATQGLGALLTPGEVAEVFRVDPKTVTRWANAGRLPSIQTPGGHRRFWEADVLRMLAGRAPRGGPGGDVNAARKAS